MRPRWLRPGTRGGIVSAPTEAFHGLSQANSTTGGVFHDQFGEVCRVVFVINP